MESSNIFYFIQIVQREFNKWKINRSLQFITLVGPIIAFLLVAWIFSSNVPRKLPFAIVDQDHTALSRQMERMIDATPIAKVRMDYLNQEEAKQAVLSGEVEGVLVIPTGLEKDILKGTGTSVALYLNNSNALKGSLLNSGVRKAIATLSSGIKLQIQMKNGLTQDQAMSKIAPVQLRQVLLFNPYTSYSYYLTATLLPIILFLFVLLNAIYVIGDEFYKGTGPEWLKISGGNLGIALSAKLLPYTLLYSLMALLMDIILIHYLGMPLQGHLGVILVSELLIILSYQSFAIFLVAVTSNLRLSLSLGSAYTMLALSYSGLTFPIFGMSIASRIFLSFCLLHTG